jgi:hypothetical protein
MARRGFSSIIVPWLAGRRMRVAPERGRKGGIMSRAAWTTLSNVPTESVKWLWEGRIPLGKVTLLDGEPGFGKSLLALELAARVTRGTAMPLARDKPSEPADVVIFNDDDSLADTIRPRLEAEGADLTRVHALDCIMNAEDFTTFTPRLIIIDPLTAYLCLGCDVPPRKIMKDLTQLAKQTHAAVVVLQYLPKSGTSWAAEIYDAARSVLTITNIGHNRRRIALTKSNLRPVAEVRPLVFQIDNSQGVGSVAGWSDGV